MIDSTVAGLSIANPFTDSKAKEILGKAADELSAKKIGDNASALIKGLMAGIGVNQFTDKYGRKKDRTLINQFVVDKLATLTAATATPATTAQNSSKFYLGLDGRAIFEQEEDTDTSKATKVTLPADFKMDEFLKAIGGGATAAPTTGDIKVPDGGFVKGKVAKGDAELKKVQQLIIDKFAKKLANSPVYKKFAGFGADGVYGPTTEKLIAGLKAGFGLSDKSGSTITAELITKIQTEKIDESYLTLTGSLVEGFDMDAYSSTIKAYSAMPSSGGTQASNKSAEGSTNNAQRISDALLDFWKGVSEDRDEQKKMFAKYKGSLDDDETLALTNAYIPWLQKNIDPYVAKLSGPDKEQITAAIDKTKKALEAGKLASGVFWKIATPDKKGKNYLIPATWFDI